MSAYYYHRLIDTLFDRKKKAYFSFALSLSSAAVQEISRPPSAVVAMATARGEIHLSTLLFFV